MLFCLFLFRDYGVVVGIFERHIEDIELDVQMIMFNISQIEYWEYKRLNQTEW